MGGGTRRALITLVVSAAVVVSGCRLPMPPVHPGGLSNLGQSLAADSSGPPAASPIVVVPGFSLGCLHGGPGEWDAWTKAVAGRYSPTPGVYVFDMDACASNVEIASRLDRFLEDVRSETGADRVRLLANSMGSLAARWCLRFGDCGPQVSAFVSIAGANHGTVWTFACPFQFWSEACSDMVPGGPFLSTLNAGSEVPPDTPVATWNSWCDAVIVPHTSTFLAGADNHDVSACVGHDGWRFDRNQISDILDWLDGADPPR